MKPNDRAKVPSSQAPPQPNGRERQTPAETGSASHTKGARKKSGGQEPGTTGKRLANGAVMAAAMDASRAKSAMGGLWQEASGNQDPRGRTRQRNTRAQGRRRGQRRVVRRDPALQTR